jgi:spermidine synthase
MKTSRNMVCSLAVWLATAAGPNAVQAAVVFETTSAYHHIQVLDDQGIRVLSFNGSQETRMSLRNPLTGHFEYTEYFHLPWLWNPRMTNVLMIGLGGGSTQRAYQYYYNDVAIDTVEIDPAVVQVAKRFFNVQESPTLHLEISDGRAYLRRTEKRYDTIILDAYVSSRYGSFMPYHLATKEFFSLANSHLTADGVLAYNVMGTMITWRADILGAVYRTLKEVFPQVYLFPAHESMNVVLIATKNPQKLTLPELQQRARAWATERRLLPPRLRTRLLNFRSEPPPTVLQSPVLTDDFAPIDGLLSAARR